MHHDKIKEQIDNVLNIVELSDEARSQLLELKGLIKKKPDLQQTTDIITKWLSIIKDLTIIAKNIIDI